MCGNLLYAWKGIVNFAIIAEIIYSTFEAKVGKQPRSSGKNLPETQKGKIRRSLCVTTKGKNLQSQEIDILLQELGNDLGAQGVSAVRVMILGGAYMLLTIESRRTTQDIDVFPLNYTDSSQPDQQTRRILKSIRAVAKNNNLKRDWFNDAAYGIIGWMMPPIERMTLWRTYGVLEIFMPPPDFILATKIFGYRDKDYHDVQVLLEKLQISTREQAQAIIDQYVDRKTQAEYRTYVTLDDLFED